VLAVDVSPWLRPNAGTCPDRSFCHTCGRGDAKHQMIPGWPYSFVVALETGRTSWTAVLDSVWLEPGADLAAVTTAQLRDVVVRLIAAGQWKAGDPEVLVVMDAGYDAPAHRPPDRRPSGAGPGPAPLGPGDAPTRAEWDAAHPAGVLPPPLRRGAHLPPLQADPRPDPAPPARLRGGRPLDLARDRRPHPNPPRPPARCRPPPPLGATGGTEQAHPRPRPTRVPQPPHEDPFGRADPRDRTAAWREATNPPNPP
jgi:hypothetical protein